MEEWCGKVLFVSKDTEEAKLEQISNSYFKPIAYVIPKLPQDFFGITAQRVILKAAKDDSARCY